MQSTAKIAIGAIALAIEIVTLVFYYSTPATAALDVIVTMILIATLAICIVADTLIKKYLPA